MDFIKLHGDAGIAKLMLNRGKVNALVDQVVEELHNTLIDLEKDPDINAIIITGQGKFFSFGFDIPEFLSYSKQRFTDYLIKFTDLYKYMFLYPKPIIAAINGHAVAGGCMIASACDRRVMVAGKAKISLNEITFGSSVFAGSTEMMRFWVGSKNATEILYLGKMYSAEEAKALGLIEEVSSEDELMNIATKMASEFSEKSASAFADIKLLLRKSTADEMKIKELDSIKRFVDIWYSDSTWKKLQDIKIY
jgi:3,2-trans-enoyl-CoA isomerase